MAVARKVPRTRRGCPTLPTKNRKKTSGTKEKYTADEVFFFLLQLLATTPPLVPVYADVLSLIDDFAENVTAGKRFTDPGFVDLGGLFSCIDWHDLKREDGPQCGLSMLGS